MTIYVMIERATVLSLARAFDKFAEVCNQAAKSFRLLNSKYGHYIKGKRIINRPIQRLKKTRHGKK